MTHSPELSNIASALSSVQAGVRKAKRNQRKDDYLYADIEAAWGACRGTLETWGITVLQHPSVSGKGVTTMVLHVSGEWICFESAIEHGLFTIDDWTDAVGRQRRIGLMGVLGIVQEPEKRVTPKTAKQVIEANRKKQQVDPHDHTDMMPHVGDPVPYVDR